jgi:CO dehydrogenase/acetyl-CoA synthase beta subunit
MQLFDKHIDQIRHFLERYQAAGKAVTYTHAQSTSWPASRRQNLVLAQDTGVELGHPNDLSSAFLLWTNDPAQVVDGRITVVGPDLPELKDQRASFGKIVIAAGMDFNEENSFERYRAMELLRYDLDLKGYMMRGVSQHQREWSRVSREALDNGFSFKVLGGALLDQFARLPYIAAAEAIFITEGRQAVSEIQAIADEAIKIIGAMNKMAEELSFDCRTCEYNDVCNDVAELRSMRKAFKNRKDAQHA